jgi:hypothetical protein
MPGLSHRHGMGTLSRSLATGHARTAGATEATGTPRTVPSSRARPGTNRPLPTLRRPVTRRRLVRRRRLPVRTGRHRVGNGSGAEAGPVSAGPAADAVGIGPEAGIGGRLATHPAKLPPSPS